MDISILTVTVGLILVVTNWPATAHEGVGMNQGAGQGEIPDDSNQRERVAWLINELGYARDGYTVRESIHGTDHRVWDLEDEVAALQDGLVALQEEKPLTTTLLEHPFVVAIVIAGIVGVVGELLRTRYRVARLQGYIDRLQSDQG